MKLKTILLIITYLSTIVRVQSNDLISSILDNVIVVDPVGYVPNGYVFSQEHTQQIQAKREKDTTTMKPITNEENFNEDNKVDNILENAGNDLFSAILRGESISVSKSSIKKNKEKKLNKKADRTRPPVSIRRTTTITTTTTTTTLRPSTRGPPPGFCFSHFEVCSISGSLVVETGISWSKDLLQPTTSTYQDTKAKLVIELSRAFDLGYFGSQFRFVDVVEISKREKAGILFDLYLEFRGLEFDITTYDVKDAFEEVLGDGGDGFLRMMGDYGINISSTYFLVVDPRVTAQSVGEKVPTTLDVEIPEWAWMVIIGGSISTLIIALIGCLNGCQRWRTSQSLSARTKLDATTLSTVRGLFQSFHEQDGMDPDVTVENTFRKDSRDMWTLQKIKEREDMKKMNTYINGNKSSSMYHPAGDVVGSCGGASDCDSVEGDRMTKKINPEMVKGWDAKSGINLMDELTTNLSKRNDSDGEILIEL